MLKFFSNVHTRAYLRGLAEELGESTNAIRVELNRLTEAGLLNHVQEGNTIVYNANTNNPFFKELNKLVLKYMGMDDIVESVVSKIGDLDLAFITGDYALGKDSGIIELVLVAKSIDQKYLKALVKRGESITGRKINLLTYLPQEFEEKASTYNKTNALILYDAKHFI